MENLNLYIKESLVNHKVKSKEYIDYVDLGLPTGTLWATCNIGADKPENPGLLFQWGRIDGYKYSDENKFLNKKYCTNSGYNYKPGQNLKPIDDAAYQLTNGRFRMPTKDEIDELYRYTEGNWEEINDIVGQKLISKKDNSKWIFIPASGYWYPYNFCDIEKEYRFWSSSIDKDVSNSKYPYASTAEINEFFYNDNFSNTCAMSIRGVLVK